MREIYYSIFDSRGSLLQENEDIKDVKSSKKALLKYLKEKGETLNVKRCNRNFGVFCVTPLFMEEGTRYKYSNRVWYRIV